MFLDLLQNCVFLVKTDRLESCFSHWPMETGKPSSSGLSYQLPHCWFGVFKRRAQTPCGSVALSLQYLPWFLILHLGFCETRILEVVKHRGVHLFLTLGSVNPVSTVSSPYPDFLAPKGTKSMRGYSCVSSGIARNRYSVSISRKMDSERSLEQFIRE